MLVINHFYFLLVQRRNSVFVNFNVFLNKYSLQSTKMKVGGNYYNLVKNIDLHI